VSQATFYMTDGSVVLFEEVVDIAPAPGGVRVRYMGPGDDHFTNRLTLPVEKELTILSGAYNHYYWTEEA
jgi:hypothetical protein